MYLYESQENDALDAKQPRASSVDALLQGGSGDSAPARISALIRGPKSLGGLLEQRGCRCTPRCRTTPIPHLLRLTGALV